MSTPKILICISNAEASMVAFRFGCLHARAIGATVEALVAVSSVDLRNPFVSEIAREEEVSKAETLLEGYIACAQDLGVPLNTIVRVGVFEEVVIKVVNGDSDISMIIVGYSVDSTVRQHSAATLLAGLGRNLIIPMVIVPSNLTDHQVQELVTQ
jgi:hypothetical protein